MTPNPAPSAATHECGEAHEATTPGSGHYEQHRKRGETRCPKSLAEMAWAAAEKRAGRPLPDWEPYEPPTHECGQADEATEPSAAHYGWHHHRGETPCPKSRAEVAHYQAIREGRGEGYAYGRRATAAHICGEAEEAAEPGTAHYGWHRNRGETPCPKSRAENAWARAERRAGHPLPHHDYQPRPHLRGRASKADHECGQAHEGTEPSGAHYEWHRYHRTEPCPKSRAEAAHYDAARRGRGDGYEYRPQGTAAAKHECGEADQATEASQAHYQWHRYHRTEPCPKSLAESNRYQANRYQAARKKQATTTGRAGLPPPKPLRPKNRTNQRKRKRRTRRRRGRR